MIGSPDISYSRLKAYQECPWQYKLLYIERKRAPVSAPSSLGHSLHRTLAAFYQARGASLDQLLDLYEDNWQHAGYSSPQEQALYHKKGRQILERFWPLEQDRRSKILHVEKEFEFPLGAFRVRGIIDRVDERPDGSVEVIDYKSQQDPQDEGQVERNLQLRIYGLGCREALNLAPSWQTILYLSSARSVSAPCDASGDEDLKALLLEVLGRVAAGDFAPDLRHCPACPLRRSCEYSVSPS